MLSGEKIQLPFYTLLTSQQDNVEQVSYLPLDPVSDKTTRLQGEELSRLSQDVQQRLENMVSEMAHGQGLPAWGDSGVCRYCDMNRLCRLQVWENEVDDHGAE